MPDYTVIIGNQSYTVTAPNQEIVTAAGRRLSEWMAANPTTPEPAGPRVPNEGVTWEQEQAARQIDQFGRFLSEETRAGRPRTEKIGDWTRNVGNALTLGNFNELVAVADNLLGNRDNMTFQERLAYEDQQDALHRQENPISSTVVDIAGGLATPAAMMRGGASFLSGARPTASSVIPRSVMEGAGYGAVAGFGEGEGFNPIERLRNAGAGALTGAATGLAVGAPGGAVANRSAVNSAPTREALGVSADAAYDTMRAAGVRFNANGFENLLQRIDADLQGQNLGAMTGSATERWHRELMSRIGQAPTLEEIDLIRRDIQAAAREARSGASPRLDDARLLDRMITAIDDFVLDPAAPIMSGNLAAGQAALAEGRRLSLASRKSTTINEAIDSAAISAGMRQGNPSSQQGAMANAFRVLANDADKMRMFTAEERRLIEEVAGGAWTENTLRQLGRLAPGNLLSMGGIIPAAAGIGGAYAAGGLPAAAGAAAAGEVGGRLSSSMTRQNAALVDALSRSSGAAGPNAAIIPIIQALTATGATQGIQAPPTQALLDLLLPPRQQGMQ